MNIYDVAEKAGVSTTTVSRVINGSGSVSEETKQKVRRVMRELNYIPSQIAVGLATNSTKTIGIMLPDVRDSFHALVAYLIESQMAEKGYTCILCNTSVENNKETDYLDSLYRKKVDGIILVGSSYHKSQIDEVYRQWEPKIPLVLINAVSAEGTASVICDEKDGMRQALQHLKESGRCRPVFIKDASDYQRRASVTKAQAFLEAFREVYMTEVQPQIFICRPEEEDYKNLLREIDEQEADSILFTNDMSCAVFLKMLEKQGRKVPEEFALVGFNNARITDLTSPMISTIDHLVAAHCELAVEKLMHMLRGDEVEKITYIKPKFVQKETT